MFCSVNKGQHRTTHALKLLVTNKSDTRLVALPHVEKSNWND
jgi:hypothetical protein